jgi:HD-GYP domain-containing protein (c-di-GMP phosphodiesterase class II)
LVDQCGRDFFRREEIPLAARILSVVDAYDAMTSPRSYRRALSPEEARKELQDCSDQQFDPQVVESFLKIVRV